MTDVNIMYWFRDLQIYFFFIENQVLRKKSNFVALPLPWFNGCWNDNICPPAFWKYTSLELVFIFELGSKFCRVHTNVRLLSHFHMKYWPILLFLARFWAWFDRKFYAELQKHRFYGVWSPIEGHESPITKFVGH
jgi:hypothetical protein